MKKLSLIIAALLWAAPFVMAEPCPCAGGTMPYQYDCDSASPGVNDACERIVVVPPTISPPVGQPNQINVDAGPVPSARVAWTFEGTMSPVEEDPVCQGQPALIYHRHTITPVSHSITLVTKENRFTLDVGSSGDANACGLSLTRAVNASAGYSVGVSVAATVKGVFSFGVSVSKNFGASAGVPCNVDGTDYQWLYYDIYDHSARLTGGTYNIAGSLLVEEQIQYCNDPPEVYEVSNEPNFSGSFSANISTQWEDSGFGVCVYNSSPCCMN